MDKNNDVYEIINLGSNGLISLRDTIEKARRVLRAQLEIEQLPMQLGDVDRTRADILEVRRLLWHELPVSSKEAAEQFIK